MLLDDLMADRQTQSRAHTFSCESGVEYFGYPVRGDSASGVGDGNSDFIRLCSGADRNIPIAVNYRSWHISNKSDSGKVPWGRTLASSKRNHAPVDTPD